MADDPNKKDNPQSNPSGGQYNPQQGQTGQHGQQQKDKGFQDTEQKRPSQGGRGTDSDEENERQDQGGQRRAS